MKEKYDVKYFLIVLILLTGTIFSVLSFSFQKETTVDIFKQTQMSVVEIKAESEDVGESFGTAVFVQQDGTLVTNAHVVSYKKTGTYIAFEKFSIRFSFENDYREVSLIKFDNDKDLAVLKLNDVNCNFKPITFADSDKIDVGDEVFAVGNLNNVGISLTKGIVSNKKINVEYNGVSREVIQCDLTIAEGNSGGALVNKNGELLGITTFRLKDNSNNVIYGICYALPTNVVSEYLK